MKIDVWKTLQDIIVTKERPEFPVMCEQDLLKAGEKVVRLSEVDTILREAVWAMEAIATDIAEDEYYYGMSPEELERKCQEHVKYQRAQAFLASVAEWREREEGNRA